MKKHFRTGLGLLIPIALVAQVLWWVYGMFDNLVRQITPQSYGYEWWYPLILVGLLIIFTILLGFLFSFVSPLKWLKNQVEKHIVNKIPIVNKIYNFGKDISDSFITDIKDDGDLQVVEVDMGGFKLLGVLTDEKNQLGFILSAPSPLTGVVMKLPNYRKLEISFLDAVQINTSLGRINGSKWKEEKKDVN